MSNDVKLFRSPAHQALAAREAAIYDRKISEGPTAYLEAVNEDRRERWAELLLHREESVGIRSWAAKMQDLHKRQPLVRVHRNALPWITALYVVRYGEAEDYWPSALTEGDLDRAKAWLAGATPEGVHYIGEV